MLRVRSSRALFIFWDRDLKVLAHTALLHLSTLSFMLTVHRRPFDFVMNNLLIRFALAQNIIWWPSFASLIFLNYLFDVSFSLRWFLCSFHLILILIIILHNHLLRLIWSVSYRAHSNLEDTILQLFHFFLINRYWRLLNILFLDSQFLIIIVPEVEFLDLLQVLWPLRLVLQSCSLSVILTDGYLAFGGW